MPPAPPTPASGSAPAFDAWMDDVLASWLRRRPVHATFVGAHEHDARLPDLTEEGAGDTLAEMEGLRSRLEALPPERLDGPRATDRRLARGVLELESRELRSRHFHRGNPSLYTGEAAFGIIGLFLTDYAPLGERVGAAVERLEALPAFLATARDQVRAAPAEWTARAVRECGSMEALFLRGLPRLARDAGIDAPALLRAGERAADAVAGHARTLEGLPEPSDLPGEGYPCGAEMLAAYVRDGHALAETPDAVAERAEAALAEAEARLRAGAGDQGASTPDQALARLRELHPTLDDYYARYGEVWATVKARAEALGLVTWPDDPIRFVPRPEWVREAARDLYFLFYRSPAAYGRPPVHDYLVMPVDAALPEAERERRLRESHDAVIKLNHVIHHGGLGHHVQNGHAFRGPSRIGRVAAVDCASRIAMTCGGTMAEGWACYATDLAAEAGLLTPLEAYAELRSRARMCARAVVDVRLHQGEVTLDEAARFYEERAGMPPSAARAEAVKNSMFPGAALMYMTGTDALHELRREVAARRGAAFDPGAFHDAVLDHGSVPVALVAASMLAPVGSEEVPAPGEPRDARAGAAPGAPA